jgi:hypothetical protein
MPKEDIAPSPLFMPHTDLGTHKQSYPERVAFSLFDTLFASLSSVLCSSSLALLPKEGRIPHSQSP